MQVVTHGFSLEAGNEHISVLDLFQSMIESNGVVDTTKSNDRYFYVDLDSHPGFVSGLVITVRDQKKFVELQDEEGNFKFRVTDLAAANKIMEFNFYVLNTSNGLGLYQYYNRSCSLGTFGSYLVSRYRALSDASRDRHIQRLHDAGEHTRKRETLVRSEHRGGLQFSILFRPDELGELLVQFKEIRSFVFELVGVSPIVSEGQPLSGYASRVREKVTFLAGSPVKQVAAGILEMTDKVRSNTARVYGIDDDDIPVSMRVANIPANFGEAEYDEVSAELHELAADEFANHPPVLRLIEKCRGEHAATFMAEIEG